MGRYPRWWMLLLILPVTVLALGGLAACGGDDDSSTTAAEEGAGEEGAGESAAEDPAVEAAQERVAEAKAPPTTWEGPTEPVKAIKDLRLATVSCDAQLSGCTNTVKFMQEVVENELGWTVDFNDGKSDPARWNAAMEEAVAADVDAIALSSISPPLIQKGLAAAEKAGIPVIDSNDGSFEPNPTVDPEGRAWPFASIDIDYTKAGAANADWVIADSGGEANVLMLTDPAYASVTAHTDAFGEQIEAECPNCTLETMVTTTAEAATKTPQKAVAALRSNPDIDYMYVPYDPLAGFIVPAIKQAGFQDRVKLASILGNQQNLEFIANGDVQVTDVAFDEHYSGWAMTDQVLRKLNDQPLSRPIGENVPWQLVDPENIDEVGTGQYTAEFDYESEFRKLWGLE